MILIIFMILFDTCFGIDCGWVQASISTQFVTPFGVNFMCVFAIVFLMNSRLHFWWMFYQNGSKKSGTVPSIFGPVSWHVSDQQVPETMFSINKFFMKLIRCIHTCTFYQGKTDKCAVPVFKKKSCRKHKISNAPRHDFGTIVASTGTLSVSFWLHLGRVGVFVLLHFEVVKVRWAPMTAIQP